MYLPEVSWLFFEGGPSRAGGKAPIPDSYGRANNAENSPPPPAQRVAMKMGGVGVARRCGDRRRTPGRRSGSDLTGWRSILVNAPRSPHGSQARSGSPMLPFHLFCSIGRGRSTFIEVPLSFVLGPVGMRLAVPAMAAATCKRSHG
jgi:hypothetical protein